MWTRESLKNEAKSTFAACRGNSILVCLIVGLVSGGGSGASSSSSSSNLSGNMSGGISVETVLAILAVALGVSVITIALQILVTNLLSVGSSHFFLSSRVKPSSVEMLLFPFKNGRYGKVLGAMFMTNLFIGLWSLLFVIPGIYKAYQYRMVPYLLAENPEMGYQRAIELSKAMMDGEKMNAFVLDLSFLGWYILSIFTCGILAIVYVSPYQAHTNAGLYIALREKAVNSGLVNPAELYAVVQG